MNKLGNYHEDERGHYNFSFSDNDGKHVQVSFRAEPNYDLNMVFNEFKNFLIASGHDVDGEIGELAVDRYHEGDGWDIDSDEDSDEEAIQAMKQYQSADGKFSMDHFPSNGWPFGGLTTTDFASLTPNQFPTMAPLTQEQVQSWTLSSMDIQALTSADLSRWTVPSPGTIGGAKVTVGSVNVNENAGHYTNPYGKALGGGGGILK
jgi:hypothetical protein